MTNAPHRQGPPIPDSKKRLAFLHLVWAIPVAIVFSLPPWSIAQWGLCFSEACGAGLDRETVTSLAESAFLVLFSSGVWWGILRFVPWTENLRLRQWVAISAACGVVLVTVLFGLFWALS